MSTLYNRSVTQTATLKDNNNQDTDLFNGVNRILYSAISTNGDVVKIGFTKSIATTQPADAFNIPTGAPVAGTGGNDTDMKFDLSKQLDGSTVSLVSKIIANNKEASDSFICDKVWIETEFQVDPIPNDGSSYDVFAYLLVDDNAGVQYTRLNGLAEYEFEVYLVYFDKEGDFDPDIPDTYLAKETVEVNSFDGGTKSGGSVSFAFDFPDTRNGSIVCAFAYLKFFQHVDGVPADQIGFARTANTNNRGFDCGTIDGTPATGTVSLDQSTIPTDGTLTTIDGVEMLELDTPINVEFTIDVGGATSAFSSEGIISQVTILANGVPVDWSDLGVALEDGEFPVESAGVNGLGTDGFSFTINYIESGAVNEGDIIIVQVETGGVSDSPNSDTFQFDNTPIVDINDLFTDCPSAENCVGIDCGTDPSIALTVSGASGTINWCGKTWNLPADSGVIKCVCPTSYTSPAPFANKEIWNYNTELGLYDSTTFGFIALRKVRLNPTAFGPIQSLCSGTNPTTCGGTSTLGGGFAGSPIRGSICLPLNTPNSGTVNADIRDCQFFNYVSGGITYQWERGQGW